MHILELRRLFWDFFDNELRSLHEAKSSVEHDSCWNLNNHCDLCVLASHSVSILAWYIWLASVRRVSLPIVQVRACMRWPEAVHAMRVLAKDWNTQLMTRNMRKVLRTRPSDDWEALACSLWLQSEVGTCSSDIQSDENRELNVCHRDAEYDENVDDVRVHSDARSVSTQSMLDYIEFSH